MNETDEIKRKIVAQMVAHQMIRENSKYGELVIQTNEIQVALSYLIFSRSGLPDDDFRVYVFERATLGQLVVIFPLIGILNQEEKNLLRQLKEYNKIRNRLAHKMSTEKRLTSSDCVAALRLGKALNDTLFKLTRQTLDQRTRNIRQVA